MMGRRGRESNSNFTYSMPSHGRGPPAAGAARRPARGGGGRRRDYDTAPGASVGGSRRVGGSESSASVDDVGAALQRSRAARVPSEWAPFLCSHFHLGHREGEDS